MRIAFISDIHGHAIALDAVLSDIQKQQIDQIICLGDIITIGFQPRQVLSTLQKLNYPTIMGNHDAALLEPEKALEYRIAKTLIPTFHWCRNQLTAADFDYLRSFVPTLTIPLTSQKTIFCFHGSPKSNIDSILATTPTSEVEAFLHGVNAEIMIGGHTHMQMVRLINGRWLVNPGSVGSPFPTPYVPGNLPSVSPWAEYAILDWREDALGFDSRRVYFDLDACRQAIKDSGIPNVDWWLDQYSQ